MREADEPRRIFDEQRNRLRNSCSKRKAGVSVKAAAVDLLQESSRLTECGPINITTSNAWRFRPKKLKITIYATAAGLNDSRIHNLR